MPYKQNNALITSNPAVMGGAPCVRGLPIKVQDVAECFTIGMTMEEIRELYPVLTRDDFRAIAKYIAESHPQWV